MNSLNYIFGLTPKSIGKTNVEDIRTGLITNISRNVVSIGTPCFIISNQTNEIENRLSYIPHKRKIAIIPFAVNSNMIPRYKLDSGQNVNNLVIKETSKKNIFTSCKSLSVNKINEIELNKVFNQVNNFNTLNITVKPSKGMEKDFKNFMIAFSESFEITSLIFQNYNKEASALSDDSHLSIVISDIKNHIPTFDYTQSDGFFMDICCYSPKLSEQLGALYFSFEINIAFSNYSKNLLEIDGQDLNRSQIQIDYLNKLLRNRITPYLEYLSEIDDKKSNTSVT